MSTQQTSLGRSIHVIALLAVIAFVSACSTAALPPTAAPTIAPRPTMVTEPTEAEIPAAGQVCEAALEATVGPGTPAGPVLILINHAGEDKWVIKYHDRLPETTSDDLSKVATVVCIDEWVEKVGCYTSSGQAAQCGVLDPPAYKPHWDIRLAQWPDGQVIAETTLTGGDPPTSTVGGAAGFGERPLDGFQSWLLAQLGQP